MVQVNSMIDISDGLSSDLNRICRQSGVGAVIDAKLIPISEQAFQKQNPLGSALNEGEDFELLFTASVKESRRIIKILICFSVTIINCYLVFTICFFCCCFHYLPFKFFVKKSIISIIIIIVTTKAKKFNTSGLVITASPFIAFPK